MASRSRDYGLYLRIARLLNRLIPRPPREPTLSQQWPQQRGAAHAAAVFHPYVAGECPGLPAIEVAGVLVFAYLDNHAQALRVSIDLDTVAPWLLNDAERVPMLISVQGDEVYSADYPRGIR